MLDADILITCELCFPGAISGYWLLFTPTLSRG